MDHDRGREQRRQGKNGAQRLARQRDVAKPVLQLDLGRLDLDAPSLVHQKEQQVRRIEPALELSVALGDSRRRRLLRFLRSLVPGILLEQLRQLLVPELLAEGVHVDVSGHALGSNATGSDGTNLGTARERPKPVGLTPRLQTEAQPDRQEREPHQDQRQDQRHDREGAHAGTCGYFFLPSPTSFGETAPAICAPV